MVFGRITKSWSTYISTKDRVQISSPFCHAKLRIPLTNDKNFSSATLGNMLSY